MKSHGGAQYLRVRVLDVVDDGRGEIACRFFDGTPRAPNGLERAFADAIDRTASRSCRACARCST